VSRTLPPSRSASTSASSALSLSALLPSSPSPLLFGD